MVIRPAMMDITMDEPGQSIRRANKRASAYFISPPETPSTHTAKVKERETVHEPESERMAVDEVEVATGESVGRTNKRAPAYFASPPETAIARKGKGKERESAHEPEPDRIEMEEGASESVK